MRVLYYSAHPDLPLLGDAGYSTHMRGMIGGLEANEAVVVPTIAGGTTRPFSQTPAEATQQLGIKHKLRRVLPRSAWNGLRDLRLLKADVSYGTVLAGKLEGSSFDLVYERHTYLHRQGPIIARRHGVPHVLEINSPPDERSDIGGNSPLDRLGRRFALEAVEATDLAVFVSSALRESYEGLLGRTISNAVVVPNAVASNTIRPLRPTVRESMSSSPIKIGFVGSLMEWHGIDLLIESFAAVHGDRPNTVLEIVGDGELRPKYEAQVRERQLSHAITFTGALPHAQALERVESFDIGVMVRSNSYGSPVKLFEYAASGCAIVAPNVEPAHEVLTDEVEALFVSPNQLEITTALSRLVDDPALRSSLGLAAQRRISSHNTWDMAASTVLNAIAEQRSLNG